MNKQEFQEWEVNVKKETFMQIILNRLKKFGKINRKQEKMIKQKIKFIGYKNLLKSPHLEGKEDLSEKARQLCFQDYCSFIGITKNASFY